MGILQNVLRLKNIIIVVIQMQEMETQQQQLK